MKAKFAKRYTVKRTIYILSSIILKEFVYTDFKDSSTLYFIYGLSNVIILLLNIKL